MKKETHESAAGQFKPEVYKEWLDLLKKPRVIKPSPAVDEDKAYTVMLFLRRGGLHSLKVQIPAGKEQHYSHAHLEGAVFYIREGKGHEIHDGVRYDWEAGDAMIVNAGGPSVHQHFNDDLEPAAKCVVFVHTAVYRAEDLVAGGQISLPKGVDREQHFLRDTIYRGGSLD